MPLKPVDDADLLLGTQDVPPVGEHNEAVRSPFFLTCDHYGRLIPRALGDVQSLGPLPAVVGDNPSYRKENP